MLAIFKIYYTDLIWYNKSSCSVTKESRPTLLENFSVCSFTFKKPTGKGQVLPESTESTFFFVLPSTLLSSSYIDEERTGKEVFHKTLHRL